MVQLVPNNAEKHERTKLLLFLRLHFSSWGMLESDLCRNKLSFGILLHEADYKSDYLSIICDNMGCFSFRRKSIIHSLDLQIGVGTTVSEDLSLIISWELAYTKFHLLSLHLIWMAKLRWYISHWCHQYFVSTLVCSSGMGLSLLLRNQVSL